MVGNYNKIMLHMSEVSTKIVLHNGNDFWCSYLIIP